MKPIQYALGLTHGSACVAILPMKFVNHNDLSEEPISHDPDISKKVILRSGAAEHITQLATANLLPGQKTTSHTHKDMTEIYTVSEGELLFTVNDRDLSVSAPGTVVIEPGEEHSVANASIKQASFLYFGVLSGAAEND